MTTEYDTTEADLFDHPPETCPLAELCPDLYSRQQNDQIFDPLATLLAFTLARGIPAPLVVWHLVSAAAVLADAGDVDAETVVRALRFAVDEVKDNPDPEVQTAKGQVTQ